ncbi:hypothetical protein Emag_006327 [Eimeria magna]
MMKRATIFCLHQIGVSPKTDSRALSLSRPSLGGPPMVFLMVLLASKGALGRMKLPARRGFCLKRGPPKSAAATTRGLSTAAAAAATAATAAAYTERDRFLCVLAQQQQQQQQQQHRSQAGLPESSPLSRGAPQGESWGAPLPAFSSVQLPSYIRKMQLGGWQLYFYPLPQYLKSMDPDAAGGPPGGAPSGWEGASLVAALRPQLLCLECCSNRLQQLIAAAAAVAAATRRGASLQEETQKQQRRLAKGFSLLTAFDGGLLHAALLPAVVAAAMMGGPQTGAPVPIDRDRLTTARRLHELLLLQPTQLRALRVCVLQSLSRRWLRGPPDPVGAPGLGAPTDSQDEGAPQWALQQKENFPAGYQVLLEERASCAATALWNAIRDAEEETLQGGPPGGPLKPMNGLEGAPVGLVFCSAALLPLLVQSLQQLHAIEAPKAAAAAAAGGARYRSSFGAALHQSPPCLLPLLLLRFLVLPAAAAYGIAAAAAALTSWLQASLHRGDPPAAAAAAELRVAIEGGPGAPRAHRGAPRGRQLGQDEQTTIL